MASIITHALVGVAAGKTFFGGKMSRRFWDLTIVCALLPDLDVILFRFGVSYGDFFGHRGFSHSPFFALLVSIAVVLIFYRKDERWWFYLIYFFFVTAMNGVLDAMTNGGLGVAFLSPFSNERFFLPWRPIVVSPLSAKYFLSGQMARAMGSEILYIWIPAFLIVILSVIFRRRSAKGRV